MHGLATFCRRMKAVVADLHVWLVVSPEQAENVQQEAERMRTELATIRDLLKLYRR